MKNVRVYFINVNYLMVWTITLSIQIAICREKSNEQCNVLFKSMITWRTGYLLAKQD